MKILIPHSSNCGASFSFILSLLTRIALYPCNHGADHGVPGPRANPVRDEALLVSLSMRLATHCNVNSGAPQSDWANGVPSHQAVRPTRTCREIVHIKPVGKLADAH